MQYEFKTKLHTNFYVIRSLLLLLLLPYRCFTVTGVILMIVLGVAVGVVIGALLLCLIANFTKRSQFFSGLLSVEF